MGYYVKSDYSRYYEGAAKEEVSDIEVTQRPHVVCEWDGAAWTYPIASCQAYQKSQVMTDMVANLESILSNSYSSIWEVTFAMIGMVEATAFEDDTGRSAASVSFLDGWKTQMASATLQDAADDVQTRYILPMVVFGKALAQKAALFDDIDAEVDGLTCLSYDWVTL